MNTNDAIKLYNENEGGISHEKYTLKLEIEDYINGVLELLYAHNTILGKSIFNDLKRNGKLVECFYNDWFFENSIRDFMENYETIKEEKVVGYERVKPKMFVSIKEINKVVDLDAPSTTKATTTGGII
jgi:hypothetical protein